MLKKNRGASGGSAKARNFNLIMLSIERCKEILKIHNYQLNNEEIKQVREFLHILAEIQINAEKRLAEDEECNTILSC
jgi:hypothetical protein